MYTINAAYAINNDDRNGSLEAGKLADMVIIDRDPYEYADSKEIYDIRVIRTIKEGRTIYEA